MLLVSRSIIVAPLLYFIFMDVDITQFKYGKYKRKSSDDEDKQVQSLRTQDRELRNVEDQLQLHVVAEWEEERSAFVLGRPDFAELVDMTKRGQINAWLIWHLTRLSRNPVDAGMVIHLMDIGKLHHIRTPTRVYYNNPADKMLLQFELVFSKKDSDDKSIFIKDNIVTKAEKGIPHGMAPLGFLNSKHHSKGAGYWLVDEEGFPKIEHLLRIFLKGINSARQLHATAKDDVRLRTHITKQLGGKPLTRWSIYKLLANPIYAGFFFHEGKRYDLDARLPRAITEAEYWTIQTMLGRKGRPKPKKREALYNHFMRDADGGSVTPDFKFQLICSSCKHKFSYQNKEFCPKCEAKIDDMNNPTYLSYIYYYSTKEKKAGAIRGKGIEEKQLDKALINFYDEKLVISPVLSEWCIDEVPTVESEDQQYQELVSQSLEDAKRNIEQKLERLLDLRLNKTDMTDDEASLYDAKEKKLRTELAQVRAQQGNNKDPADWIEKAKTGFQLLPELVGTIENGDLQKKREVLDQLGSNLTLTDGKVSICSAKWVEALIKGLEDAKRKNSRFEPKNIVDTTDQNQVFASVRPILRRAIANVRTYLKAKF